MALRRREGRGQGERQEREIPHKVLGGADLVESDKGGCLQQHAEGQIGTELNSDQKEHPGRDQERSICEHVAEHRLE
eukprot:scaffold3766_cov124-Isochrysis_galbana.AAC.2